MPLTRRARRVSRQFRQARMFVASLKSPHRPILAHLIPIRRCNLSCTYCNEFDDHSAPVPTADVLSTDRSTRRARNRHRHAERWRAAAASGSRCDHQPHPPARDDRDADHQWLSADTRSHRATESRRPRSSSNQHRQRRARRGLEEEPQGARSEAAVARRARASST